MSVANVQITELALKSVLKFRSSTYTGEMRRKKKKAAAVYLRIEKIDEENLFEKEIP